MPASVTFQQSAVPRGLNRGEIHIWHARLELLAGMAQGLLLTLSPDEQRRAEKFRFEKDRNRYAMSRGILRDLLGRYLGISPGSVQFHYGAHGKPYLSEKSSPYPIHFSLSHSCGLVLFGFSLDQKIGIDVEHIRTDFDFESIAKKYLSASEFAKLLALAPAARSAEFFRWWTRIEAYAKARGIGISLLDDQGMSSPVGEMSNWKLEEFTPEVDYVASVASTLSTSILKHWKYSHLRET
ncbi:MAG: 4'-phosphopantetheinyl transferase superfamily protein [Candidatus Acidiferrum sp.]